MREPWEPTDHAQERGGLQKRVVRGLRWTLIDTWGSQLLGLLVFLILSRLLGVGDVGLVALAAAFVALAQLFVDLGLGDALIQRLTLTRGQIDTAFWAAVGTGSLLTLAGILLAWPISIVLNEPALAPVLQLLSFSFLLTAFSSIQTALLRREMAFRSLAIRRLLAISGGGALGVTLAYLGFGPYALVGQQLAAAIVSVVALWTVSPWRPGFSVSRKEFRQLFSFGGNIVAGDLLFFLSRNVDNLLIGVFLGAIPLGLYALAYRFLDTSVVLLVNAFRKVVFPAFSRLQNDTVRLQQAYTRMSRAAATVILPGYIGLALVAQDAIVVLAGDKWADSGLVASILFLIGPVLTVQISSGVLFNAVGHPEVTLRFRLLTAVANVVGFLIAVLAFGSILAVAAAYTIRGYLLVPVALLWMRRYAGIPIGQNIVRLRGVAIATGVMALAILAVKVAFSPSVPTLVVLAASVITGMVVYGLCLLAIEGQLVRDAWSIAVQALPGGQRARRAMAGRLSRTKEEVGVPPLTTADDLDDV